MPPCAPQCTLYYRPARYTTPSTPYQHRMLHPSALQILAHLGTAPALTSLTLHLRHNKVADHGARALATRLSLSPWQALTVRLEGNPAGSADAFAEAFDPMSALTALDLSLSGLTDAGAGALAAQLRAAPALGVLTLRLDHSALGDRGAAALATLRTAPALQRVAVQVLPGNCGPWGLLALATLASPGSAQAPRLPWPDGAEPRGPTTVGPEPLCDALCGLWTAPQTFAGPSPAKRRRVPGRRRARPPAGAPADLALALRGLSLLH